MTATPATVAIVGGTGRLGLALARRWARAGRAVVLGSRDGVRAEAAAADLARELGLSVRGDGNRAAAASADLVVVTVPFAAQAETLGEIRDVVAGKIVVETTVPLMPPRVMCAQLPPEGCAAVRAQRLLGDGVRVVAAFHNVAAHRLAADAEVDCDVLVFGDARDSRATVLELVRAAGLRGLHGGALANAAAAEALTSVLIFVNKTYAADGAGLRITGIPDPDGSA